MVSHTLPSLLACLRKNLTILTRGIVYFPALLKKQSSVVEMSSWEGIVTVSC